MNDRQKKFADLIIMGRPASRAYREAGYSATGNGAEVNGHKLLKNPEIKAYIEAAKERAAEAAEIEREDIVRFYANVIRGRDETRDKLTAARDLAKMMGWNEPEKINVQSDTLRDLLIEIRARNGESEISEP